ncbi:hypothetical protein PMAYCL1PPCAC_13141 [Pristionchus mayeri]|uniref:Uncharacterized protein n=1 Tax=Pristionchus mayeri TaxID=1317129 RepID=A0AAN4ZLF4_9BILA|nr:hypothetical protein PMAYCL1PPCAC_13141 [Pristionchus mayeri]
MGAGLQKAAERMARAATKETTEEDDVVDSSFAEALGLDILGDDNDGQKSEENDELEHFEGGEM